MKHLLSDFDLSREETLKVLERSAQIKSCPEDYSGDLENRTLLMLFELPSLRTRVSFEAGMTQLGGHAIFYGVEEGGFTRGETLEDGVKVLSRYGDGIMARVLHHPDMVRIGEAATVPVINGMTDRFHPCQNLADLLTIQEKKGDLQGLKIAYVGDGACNTANSTMIGCTKVGMKVTMACPDDPEYSPDEEIKSRVLESGGELRVTNDPEEGVRDADVVYTDTWISAGMEEEKQRRLEVFPPFQVNTNLLEHAEQDCIVMHCMPVHPGQELTREVMDSERAVLIDQAENRLHAQKGLLHKLLLEW
ncbi:MAG: ornithine carbamoyltransferase [Candidatus Bathyarchaeia archaeon]